MSFDLEMEEIVKVFFEESFEGLDAMESGLLTLDASKARARLGWRSRLDFAATVRWTADWYGAWARGEDMAAFTRRQIHQFMQEAA